MLVLVLGTVLGTVLVLGTVAVGMVPDMASVLGIPF
jgi:hypothetical protein